MGPQSHPERHPHQRRGGAGGLPPRLLDLKDVQLLTRREARKTLEKFREEERSVILALAIKLVEPNFTFNKIETEARKAAAVQSVSPVYVKVKKGEIIIREGERIPARQRWQSLRA